MLNSLASYLLGYPGSSSPAEEPATVTAHVPAVDVRLSAVEADDDWLLVDKTDTDEEGSASVDATSVPSTAARLTLAVSTTSFHCEERPGSGAGLEESWFVTPPPCFTSGSVPLETSPLENLLIEHPSMSVYHRSAGPQGASATLSSSVGASPPPRSPQRGSSARKLNRPGSGASQPQVQVRARAASSVSPAASPSPAAASSPVRTSGSSGSGRSSTRNSTAPAPASTVQPQPTPRRPNAYSPYHQQQQQSAQYRTAQRLVQRAACQQLKRDSSERYNKAREILSSRNKRQRRSDRMQRHSGANNNRKC